MRVGWGFRNEEAAHARARSLIGYKALVPIDVKSDRFISKRTKCGTFNVKA